MCCAETVDSVAETVDSVVETVSRHANSVTTCNFRFWKSVFLEQWKQHEDEQGSGYTDYSEDSTLFVSLVTISFYGRIE